MREMLSPTSAIMGKGLGSDVALITDGRFSGGSHGFVVGHITPEAAEGGPLHWLRMATPLPLMPSATGLSWTSPVKSWNAGARPGRRRLRDLLEAHWRSIREQ